MDYSQIGMGMDEKTGYDAARKAAMVLTANILCLRLETVSFLAEVPDLSKIRVVKEWIDWLLLAIDHGVRQLQSFL